jgi:hypothetical protein
MKVIRYAVVLVAAIVLAVAVWNYSSVFSPVNEVVQADVRNAGITVWAHFDDYVDPSILVFDLRTVSGNSSRTDVFRVFLQTASRLKASEFKTVKLSFEGRPKFLIEGAYFRKLGEEYETQNPVYTMRTFAENVYRLDGTKAYAEWTGGLLGVLQKEMEQFSTFHDDWYLNDLTRK